jgi:hypothetical protein
MDSENTKNHHGSLFFSVDVYSEQSLNGSYQISTRQYAMGWPSITATHDITAT